METSVRAEEESLSVFRVWLYNHSQIGGKQTQESWVCTLKNRPEDNLNVGLRQW